MMMMFMISSSIDQVEQKKTLQNLDSKHSFHFHHNKQKSHGFLKLPKISHIITIFPRFFPRIHPDMLRILLDLWEHLWLLRRQAHMTSSRCGKMKKKPRHCLAREEVEWTRLCIKSFTSFTPKETLVINLVCLRKWEPIQIFCGELTNKRANELIRRTGRLAKKLINEITTSIQQSHEKSKK